MSLKFLIFYYILKDNKLIPDVKKFENYFTITTKENDEEIEESYNWEKTTFFNCRLNFLFNTSFSLSTVFLSSHFIEKGLPNK